MPPENLASWVKEWSDHAAAIRDRLAASKAQSDGHYTILWVMEAQNNKLLSELIEHVDPAVAKRLVELYTQERQLKEESASVQIQKEEVEAVKVDVNIALGDLKALVAQLASEKTNQESEVARLSVRLDNMQKEMRTGFSDLSSWQKTTRRAIDTLRIQLAACFSDLSSGQKTIRAAVDTLQTEQANDFSDLTLGHNTIQAAVDTLQAEQANDFSDLTLGYKTIQGAVETLRTQQETGFSDLTSGHQTINSRLSTMQTTQVLSFGRLIAEHKTTRSAVDKSWQQQDNKITSLFAEKRVEGLQKESAVLKEALDQKIRQLEDAQKQLDAAMNRDEAQSSRKRRAAEPLDDTPPTGTDTPEEDYPRYLTLFLSRRSIL